MGSERQLALYVSANGRSLTTILAFTEFSPCFFLIKLDVAVAAGENSYENFCVFEANFCWYGVDPLIVPLLDGRSEPKKIKEQHFVLAHERRVFRVARRLAHRFLTGGLVPTFIEA
jgi:hypothetical protein